MSSARLFIDWLAKTNQQAWQMLPISPSTDGLSPYASAGLGMDPKYGTLEQFIELKKYAHQHGVQLWGDVPYYLPAESPLVKRYPQYFSFSASAGSLKDEHFKLRQKWDMPLYKGRPLPVWKERLDFLGLIFDGVRLDAAIRFFKYERISYHDLKKDRVVSGPGESFFNQVVDYCRSVGLEPYVENISGLDMRPLYKACVKLRVATISVFTMILLPNVKKLDPEIFRPARNIDDIYFTSTHDTFPVWSYLESLKEDQRLVIAKEMGLASVNSKEMAVEVVARLREKCPKLIVAMQDWLLDPSRINIPNTVDLKNWAYKMPVPVEELPIV